MNDILYVIENSDYVKINYSKIDETLKKIPKNEEYIHWASTICDFELLSEKEKIIFAIMYESINFCFWDNYSWNIIYNGKVWHGSMALLYSIAKASENRKVELNAEFLSKLSEKEFSTALNINECKLSMIRERYNSFKQTFDTIYNKKNKFWQELYSIKTAEEMEEYISKEFTSFHDVSYYKGKKIIFNKRSRLLIRDLYCISKTVKDNIKNIDNIKGCADYNLPRYFRDEGIFIYAESLMKIIDEEIEITSGSNIEVELRANTIYVIELIKEKLKKVGKKTNSLELDGILWNLSKIQQKTLPHHTRSIYY